nr:restriction endonuclease [Marseillevirus cajuinensis]
MACSLKNKKLCQSEECAVCLGRSFASHPKAEMWSDKNIKRARDVLKSSKECFWFFCSNCSHEFEHKLSNIVDVKTASCPYCSKSGCRLCDDEKCTFCFERSIASHEKAKYWSKKNQEDPRKIRKGCERKFWFDCKKCGHDFLTTPMLMTDKRGGSWCGYCKGRKLCYREDCDFCFKASFTTHKMAKYWSKKNEKTPREVRNSSHKYFLFDCKDCKHSFSLSPHIVQRGIWCSFCGGKQLCKEDEKCSWCVKLSFASNPASEIWSSKNEKKPCEVRPYSTKEYLFKCMVCKHEFVSKPCIMTTKKKGGCCLICASPSPPMCKKSDCEWCFEWSFASHPRAAFWSAKNRKRPREVYAGSTSKYLFDCPEHGEFWCSPSSIFWKNAWCPDCHFKTQGKLKKYLKEVCPLSKVVAEAKFDWCKNPETGRHFRFDFAIGEDKIIELDGPQHFRQVKGWTLLEQVQKRDEYKQTLAEERGYKVLRLIQEDVWLERTDWREEIRKFLNICE